MEWFRHYSAARHDPKIRSLRPPLRCVLFHIWAMVAASNGEPFTVEALAIDASLTRAWAAKAILELIARRLLTESETGLYLPHNWLKRQYKSDHSTERVRAHRKRKRNVSGNHPVTAPDTETDTETEKTPLTPHTRNVSTKRSSANGKRTVQEAAADLHERVAAKLAEWDNFGSSSN